MRASSRCALIAASLLVLPACIEADVRTELRADGSGNMGVSMKFTDKFVEVMQKVSKIDSSNDLVKQSKEGMMKKPSDEKLAELEKLGLKLSEFECVADEKRLSAKLKVEFASLAALVKVQEFQGGGESPVHMGGFSLTRDDKGIYTLAMVPAEPKEGAKAEMGGAKEPAGEKKEGEAKKKDPEAEAKAQQEIMGLMGELMGEASKLKFTVAMKVPGEVVDYEPKIAAKKEDGSVTWEFTFATMMEIQMSGETEDGKDPMENMLVRFKMPEGKSLPESCLTPAKAAPAKAPEAAPMPAPAPEKPAEPR